MKTLVWTDGETTDYKPGHLVEVACIVTDMRLKELGRFQSYVAPPPREEWNPGTWDFHVGTGLIADLSSTPGIPTNANAEKSFAEFLREYCGEPAKSERERTACLAGNTVHFDHRFLEECMPAVAAFFHYRRLDVTAMKIGMEVAVQQDLTIPKEGKHRAMRDIEESIEQYKGLWAKVAAYFAEHGSDDFPWAERPVM
jgi:oligoribonuclease